MNKLQRMLRKRRVGGNIRGAGQPVYFRLRSDAEKGRTKDPTMMYLPDMGFYRNIIEELRAGGFSRHPDKVVFNKFNENVIMVFWFHNNDEWLSEMAVEYIEGNLPYSASLLDELKRLG